MLGSRNPDLGSARNPVSGFAEPRSGFREEPSCWVRRTQFLGSLLAGFITLPCILMQFELELKFKDLGH
ncbi:hypothetical protein SLEP1_g43133 [Rubroshorea leprosula]|uniref:Uncharacterized protein n=1 Tax=Rubroshorea leprosula TaxID=152421 RepID=A0AAV5LC07_9ROSI|nr:hypothetical protein SLEP1_g43133 [Rubroshorea leprosula]